MSDELDLSHVDRAVEAIGRGAECVIPLLQAIQEEYRYLPEPALRRVCELTEITPAAVAGVSTFYSQFRHRPMGEHLVRVCVGTACHVKGAGLVYDEFLRHLGIAEGDDTDPDGLFTIERVACLGCCTLAPAIQIDDVTYGYLTTETVPRVVRDFLDLDRGGEHHPHETAAADGEAVESEIRISLDTCCVARGSAEVYKALQDAVHATGARALVKGVGCAGMSHLEPLVEVAVPRQARAIYAGVDPLDAKSIVRRHFRPRGFGRGAAAVVSGLLERAFTDEGHGAVSRRALDVRDPAIAAFVGRQTQIATEHSGQFGPLDLDAYLERDGFQALARCVRDYTPDDVLAEVELSGLRGRGGAGYATASKWKHVRAAPGDRKYLVCNGDEGDPGAFMDRMMLESFPYRVIEGMAIAAYAVGADEGYLYIRAEYPLAVRRVAAALRRCEESGYLGDDILGSGFRLRLRIMEGAGAFVCGEETALLASIEGRRGMPRLRPPYPALEGLWGKPTLVNNVETYANVPWIIRHGADAFAAVGTPESRGTKVFALAGKVVRGGLIEVPMGISLREIVEEIGGGVADGKRLKAVQIGGPSGGCVPARLAHTPVDYEALAAAGAMMGSGGLVVLDDGDCMVDIARYFLEFTQDQSCGKCTFCRIGTRRMLDILERLCGGEGRQGDLELLEALCHMVRKGSLCGLGATAPNPVLTTLRYFRDEYEAHLAGRCPAGTCRALITYSITDDCIGCTRCAQHCPADAIPRTPYERHEIDQDKCIKCGSCRDVCPVDAVKVE